MNKLLEFSTDKLLSGLDITVYQTEKTAITYHVKDAVREDDRVIYRYHGDDISFIDTFTVSARQVNNTVLFSIDYERDDHIMALNSFLPENTVNIKIGRDLVPDAVMSIKHKSPWWMYPHFTSSFEDLDERTQNMVFKLGKLHYHVLPLCGDNFHCEMNSEGLFLSTGHSGFQHLSGAFLAVTASDDPFKAVEDGYKNAHTLGGIRVPLKDKRTYPEVLDGFGWCTWDSFYHDVTSEKIYLKLDEFKEKNIPVKWIIIDDGWSCVNGMKLTSFECDREKFPEGLEACISRIKNEYGVEYVGVWHSFLGYWQGIDKDSDLYREQKDNLIMTPSGAVIPAVDEEKAYRFWDAWHTWLKAQGVDFLKVDCQGSLPYRTTGVGASAECVRIAHAALERSVMKNFDGNIINCMGMDMVNVLARPMTGLSRNSDDFFPRNERGFVAHVMQNAYNAIWHSQMYYCDYDMWWSKHESAVQSGVLRAISASPIYVSDAIGNSDPSAILPTVEDDGTLMRCDFAARPTLDCFYGIDGKLLKLWNRSGDAFAVALFNVAENEITDSLQLSSVPGIDPDTVYVAYDYFSGTFTKVTAKDEISVTLESDGTSVYCLYPIFTENGEEYIMLGSRDKYVPIASKNKVKTTLADIL